ncbi:MAG: hypothetical protein U5K43_04230 [Halofilum sp. (in: g-proteobacteria)]|nr:hypothetical protein [Halofilum sp. (in: g-proteobacteria)]
MDLVYLLGVAAVVIAITVLPVMVAAKWARARRNGFLAALAAVIVATVLGQLALNLVGEPLLGFAAAFVVGCAAYALVLGTSFVAAVGIAVVATLLQLLILVGLASLGLQVPVVTPVELTA